MIWVDRPQDKGFYLVRERPPENTGLKFSHMVHIVLYVGAGVEIQEASIPDEEMNFAIVTDFDLQNFKFIRESQFSWLGVTLTEEKESKGA